MIILLWQINPEVSPHSLYLHIPHAITLSHLALEDYDLWEE